MGGKLGDDKFDNFLRAELKKEFDGVVGTDDDKARMAQELKYKMAIYKDSPKRIESKASYNNKSKKLAFFRSKIVIIVSLFLIIGISVGGVLWLTRDKRQEPNPYNTITHIENSFLKNVAPDIEFEIVTSDNNIYAEQYIEVTNEYEQRVAVNIVKNSDSNYIVKPINNYNIGATYYIKLKANELSFSEERIKDKRDIMFTIFREDTANYALIDSLQKLDDYVGAYDEESGILVFDSTIENIEEHVVTVFNVWEQVYEQQRLVQKSLIVESIDYLDGKTILLTQVPKLEAIYKTLDLYLSDYSPDIANDDAYFMSESDIRQQIVDSPFFAEIMQTSNKVEMEYNGLKEVKGRKNPEIILELKKLDIFGSQLDVDVKLTVKNCIYISKWDAYINITVSLVVTQKVDVDVSANLIGGSVSSGNTTTTDFKIGIKIEFDKEVKLPGNSSGSQTDEDRKALWQHLMDVFNGVDDTPLLEINTGTLYIPTPIPFVSVKIQPKIVNKINIKLALDATFTIRQTVETLSAREGDGISPKSNSKTEFIFNKLKISGSIEYKVGINIFIGLNIAGVVDIGIEGEVGVYARIAGGIDIVDGDLNVFKNPYLFFECGLYGELNGLFRIDLVVWKFVAKMPIIKGEQPLLMRGFRKISTIEPSQTITMQSSLQASAPTLTVNELDLYSGKDNYYQISKEKYSDYLRYVDTENIALVNGTFNIKQNAEQEFEEEFNVRLKSVVINWNFGMPSIGIDWSKPSIFMDWNHSALIVDGYDLLANTNIHIVKQPIPIQSVTLDYIQVIDDFEYEAIYNLQEKTPYVARSDKDFQISRLVKVVPNVKPSNASYKTFDFEIYIGAELIESVLDVPKTVNENGLDCFIFRIGYDDSFIGKEIRVRAVSNGYKGEYAYMNDWGVAESNTSVIATSIPAESIELSSTMDPTGGQLIQSNWLPLNLNGGKVGVNQGAVVEFEIDEPTLYPKMATRGKSGNEGIRVAQGNAQVVSGIQGYRIVVGDNALVGSQIKVIYSLGNVLKEFYIEVLKRAVENVVLTTDKNIIRDNQKATLTAQLQSSGWQSTLQDVNFIIINGQNIATLNKTNNNTAELSLKANAIYGDDVTIVAIIDGQISNRVYINVGKIDVEAVSLKANANMQNGKYEMSANAIIDLNVDIQPYDSTIKNIEYEIDDNGRGIASIDNYTNTLYIGSNLLLTDTVKIVAIVDGVRSNEIIFVAKEVSIKYLFFSYYQLILAAGDSINLEDYLVINQDASNKNVDYIMGDTTYITITNGVLVVAKNATINHSTSFVIKSVDNASKSFIVDILIKATSNVQELPKDFYIDKISASNNIKPNDVIDFKIKYRSSTVINPSIKFRVEGNAELFDTSVYTSPNNAEVEGTTSFSIRVNGLDKITVYATYKDTTEEYEFNVDNSDIVVSTEHNKKEFVIGDEYNFTLRVQPSNIVMPIAKFELINQADNQYLQLDSNGKAKFINPNTQFTQKTIAIRASIDMLYTDFDVVVLNRVTSIEWSINYAVNGYRNSTGVRYVDDLDAYLLNPNGKIYINYTLKGDADIDISSMDIKVNLDEWSKDYFEYDNLNHVLSVKNSNVQGGIYGTLVAECDGVMSEPMLLYIPKVVSTVQEFKDIEKNIFGYYVLGNDIDFAYEKISISEFAGVLDGNNKRLSRITIATNGFSGSYGLFGVNNGIIINLQIHLVNVQAKDHGYDIDIDMFVGGIAGINNGDIENSKVYAEGSIQFMGYASNLVMGGIAGFNNGKINNCIADARIYNEGKVASGIVGINYGEIVSCTNRGMIYTKQVQANNGVVGIDYGITNNNTSIAQVIAIN